MDLERFDISFDSTVIHQNLNEAFRLTQTIYLKERQEALAKLLAKHKANKKNKQEEKTISATLPPSPVLDDKVMNRLNKKERGKLIELVCHNPTTFYRHKNNKLFTTQPTTKNQAKLPLQITNRMQSHRRSSSLSMRPEDNFKLPCGSPLLSTRKKSIERDLMYRKINNILTACEVTRMKTPSIQLNKQIGKELNIVKAFKQSLDWTTDTLQELANNESEILSSMYLHHRSAKVEEAIDKRYVAQCFKETAKDPATRPTNLSNVLKRNKNRLL